ncbi:MAG: hypothetical protein AB1698_02120 [Pseudomonadota bacterium]
MIAVRVLVLALMGGALGGCVTSGGSGPGGSLASASAPPVVAAGGVLNNALGTGLDEADRQRAYNAEIAALEEGGPGTPVGWRGDNGVHGTVIAGPAYQRPGYTRCRDFSHTIFMQGKPQLARGAACRNTDGGWTAVSVGV